MAASSIRDARRDASQISNLHSAFKTTMTTNPLFELQLVAIGGDRCVPDPFRTVMIGERKYTVRS